MVIYRTKRQPCHNARCRFAKSCGGLCWRRRIVEALQGTCSVHLYPPHTKRKVLDVTQKCRPGITSHQLFGVPSGAFHIPRMPNSMATTVVHKASAPMATKLTQRNALIVRMQVSGNTRRVTPTILVRGSITQSGRFNKCKRGGKKSPKQRM